MSVYQTSHPGASRLSLRGNSFLLSGAFLALAAMPAPASADMVVTGPIPVDSERGHPFDASDRHKVPAPLAPLRYREEEFFVSSEANVYRHDRDFQTISVTGRGPYVTRLLIRRPENPKRFSGNVVVELYNSSVARDAGWTVRSRLPNLLPTTASGQERANGFGREGDGADAAEGQSAAQRG